MLTVSIAVVGAADLDDPCGLSPFSAYANFLNVCGEINLIDWGGGGGRDYKPAVPNLFYLADRCRNDNSLADRLRPTIQKQKFVVLIPRLDC